jgi:hypothetical protein
MRLKQWRRCIVNFNKLSPSGIPLWWKLYTGEKTCTRRVPPCLHCGAKWWLHSEIDGKRACAYKYEGKEIPISKQNFVCGKTFYEPDLSRWQPMKEKKK